MNSPEKKHGIKETMELLEGTNEIVKDLTEHMEDDGKISAFEWAQTAMENAPTAMKMANGIDQVDDEIKDLDQEEMKKVAAAGLELARSIWSLVGKSTAK